jgi:hypothetical protein
MSANHGNTPAAWTGVLLGMVGFVVGAIGLMLDPISYPIFWVGVGIVVLGGVAWVVMDRMGLGDSAD